MMKKAAVIMAGGSGTRLWPLSRRNRPKQLLHILDGRSLIYRTYERLASAFKPNEIYVIALAEHLPALAEELPALPPSNLIGEPAGRDTANAVALAAAILHERDPETVVGMFTADHLIRPTDKFVEVLRTGFSAVEAHPNSLVTFGIKPTEPHTGLGYVHRGENVSPGVWRVSEFVEKPDFDVAKKYLESGDYYWNSGMFVWRAETILSQVKEHMPETHGAVLKLARGWNTEAGRSLAKDLYPLLPKVSIDFAVMEKAPNVLVAEMDLHWLDVGNWTALPSVMGGDESNNTKAAKRAFAMDSDNNIFVTEDEHLIATIGVKDLVIVHSPNATLVCHRDQVQSIKDLVGKLGKEYDGYYD